MNAKHIYKRPYIYLWLTSLMVLIVGYVSYVHLQNSALDINVHDTYFVVAHQHIVYGLSSFFLLIGSMYWIMEKLKIKLLSTLTVIHVMVTLLSIILCIIGIFYFDSVITAPKVLKDSQAINRNAFTTIISMLIIIAQLLFLINVIISLIKHGLQRRTRD